MIYKFYSPRQKRMLYFDCRAVCPSSLVTALLGPVYYSSRIVFTTSHVETAKTIGNYHHVFSFLVPQH